MSLIPHSAAEDGDASHQLPSFCETFPVGRKEAFSADAQVEVCDACRGSCVNCKTFLFIHEASGRVADIYTGSSRSTQDTSTPLVH